MTRFITYILFAAAALATALPVAGQEAGRELTPSEERRQTRLFDKHVVKMGETAFSIARGYAVSPLTLAGDNPEVDLMKIRVGQELLIRKRERGKTDPVQVAREWQQMVDGTAPSYSQTGGWVAPDDTGTPQTTAGTDTPQAGGPPSDTLWSALGDAGGAGIYPCREEIRGREGLRDFTSGTPPRIALMLPLSTGNTNTVNSDATFTDFYRGALLAFENLKSQGRSAIVTLYNSGRSADKMESIVTSAEFIDTDLIIGPVYEEEMRPAVQFGEFFGVPVVSPLAALRSLDSEVLYQMTPAPATKYDKLRPLLEGDVNIILVSSGGAADDAEFEREIAAELEGRNYGRFNIGGSGGVVSLIDWERPNVLVVLAGDELAVNKALSDIYSSYFNASARQNRRADITVVGTSKWAGYGSFVSKDLFFKLGVKYVTNYHIDRSDRETKLFEARYLEVYGDFPSRAAFRGYDAVALFAGALFESGYSFPERLERVGATPLATPYRFVQAEEGGISRQGDSFGQAVSFGRGGTLRHVNDQWTLVSFSNDYNIITQ